MKGKYIKYPILILLMLGKGFTHIASSQKHVLLHENYLLAAYKDRTSSLSAINDSLTSLYNNTKCGLNYTSASVVLGKKMAVYGLPYNGIDQPTSLSITNIPASAKIEKAYIWWDLTGDDTVGSVILTNPNLQSNTFTGTLLGKGYKCWGPSAGFRANVTSAVTGNGIYQISGLPTDTTFTQNDVNGATLFIIFSDSLANFLGTIHVNNGYVLAKMDTIYQTIYGLNINNNSNGKALMLFSDFENQPGNSIKMNNGPFLSISADFWDFEQKNAVYLAGQTSSTFGISVPNDCANLIAIGAYYQTPVSLALPVITQVLDTLTSTSGLSYQWALNGNAIPGANSQTHVAQNSGDYTVVVSYSTSICYVASTPFNVITCKDKMGPNINFLNDSLWTDSTQYLLQWYRNDSLILNATNAGYKILQSGNYWVRATDTLGGCAANSDTFFSALGISEYATSKLKVFPNPNNGSFTLDLTHFQDQSGIEVSLINMNGQVVFYNAPIKKNKIEIDISFPAPGIYLLKVISEQGVFMEKIVVEN